MDKKIIKTEFEPRIFSIRGIQVMLDSDLAEIFQVPTKRINEQVKRNSSRFPEAFCFQLNNTEWQDLKSQFATSFKGQGGKVKLPWVFTEHGIAMLATRLNSVLASQMSVEIIQVFVQAKRVNFDFSKIDEQLNKLSIKAASNSEEIAKIWQFIHSKNSPRNGIFFQNQVFDAYVFSSSLISKATKSIILIDNYVDETTLLQLSKRSNNVSCTIYTERITDKLSLDLHKHNSQYFPIEIKLFKDAHDRFLILDHQELYHMGASLKDLGKRWFAFSRMDTFCEMVLKNLS